MSSIQCLFTWSMLVRNAPGYVTSLRNYLPWYTIYRADSRFAPSQWETALLYNDVSHWLDANLESALAIYGTRLHVAWQRNSRFFRLHCWNPEGVLVMGVITIANAAASSGSTHLTSTQGIQIVNRWNKPKIHMYSRCCGIDVGINY